MKKVLVGLDLIDIATADNDGLMAGREVLNIKVIRSRGDIHVFEEMPTPIGDTERPEDAIGYKLLLGGQRGTEEVFAVIEGRANNEEYYDGKLVLVLDPETCFQYIHNPYVIPQ